jgi:hypothetical protein
MVSFARLDSSVFIGCFKRENWLKKRGQYRNPIHYEFVYVCKVNLKSALRHYFLSGMICIIGVPVPIKFLLFFARIVTSYGMSI